MEADNFRLGLLTPDDVQKRYDQADLRDCAIP
jgi:hypothetical protein